MLADRFLGSLVGLAVGDALGAPLEGMTAEEIEKTYGRVEGYVEPSTENPQRWRRPGLHTDDTQQTLIVAEAILEAGRADPDVIVRKMIELSEGPRTVPFGAHRGTGRNFRLSVSMMRKGGRWNSGSRNTAGIGASMRVAPIGLFFAGDDPAIRENATLSALVTHSDPRACLAACAVAYLVGRASRTFKEPIESKDLHRQAVAFIRRSEDWFNDIHGTRCHPDVRNTYHQFGDALEAIEGSWTAPPEEVLPRIRQKATELAGYEIEHPCRGFALAGVISAIYFFLKYRDRYREAIIHAINAGGDTDSVAAITGALCGANAGEGGIPGDWRDGLLALEQIRLRALALAGQEWDEDLWRPLDEFELELTLEEDRMRRELFPEGTFPDEYEREEAPEEEPRHRQARPRSGLRSKRRGSRGRRRR